MRFMHLIAILSVGLTLTACADLYTVGRINEIPDRIDFKEIDSEENLERYEEKRAKAIHLDAQQRLFIATAQGYCAEPSPDAMASYATALGFDLDILGKNPSALTQALQNNAASIGLRTQSVTLMRDILYRMCEASNNGHLNETEVSAFLRRSQDLTAVVLAIEQLTGAVAANQVILTPSTKASASANLVSNHQLLDQIEKDVKEKERDVKRQENVVEKKKAAVGDEQSELNNASSEQEKEKAKRMLSEVENNVKTEEDNLKAAQERLKETKKVRDTIKALRDAALTNATAETTGTREFSPVVQRTPLNDKAAGEVARAVQSMVKDVLDKRYTPDVCLSYLISSEKKIQKIQEQARQEILPQTEKSKKILHRIQASQENLPQTQRRLNLLAIQEMAKQEEGASAIEALTTQNPKDLTIQNPAIKEIYTWATRKIAKLQRLGNLCEKIILKSIEKKSDDDSKAKEGRSE